MRLRQSLRALWRWRYRKPRPAPNESRRQLLAMLSREGRKKRTVFLGDSLVAFGEWSELLPGNVANRGITGDRTDDLLERLPETLAGSPSGLILLVGINDLRAGRSPEKVAGTVGQILEDAMCRISRESVIVVSILPSLEIGGAPLKSIAKTNERLESVAAAAGVGWVDAFAAFLDERGRPLSRLFETDGLHLSPEGYRSLGDVITRGMRARRHGASEQED